jgi:hypothetical protein
MPTNAIVNTLATISQYLWSNTILEENAFRGKSINSGRDTLLYLQRKALEYGIAQNLSGVTGVANYVYALIGAKVNLANTIYLNGSGGQIVNPTTGDASTLTAFNIQFTVGSGGMNDGDTTYVINYPYIMQDSVTVEMPQSNLPVDDPNQLSYEIAYTNTSATITFLNGSPNIGVQTGMQFLIKGLRFISAQASGGGGSTPVVSTAWEFVTVSADGATVYIPSLIDKDLQVAVRLQQMQVITTGVPFGNQVLWDKATAIMTAPTANTFLNGEQIAIQYDL